MRVLQIFRLLHSTFLLPSCPFYFYNVCPIYFPNVVPHLIPSQFQCQAASFSSTLDKHVKSRDEIGDCIFIAPHHWPFRPQRYGTRNRSGHVGSVHSLPMWRFYPILCFLASCFVMVLPKFLVPLCTSMYCSMHSFFHGSTLEEWGWLRHLMSTCPASFGTSTEWTNTRLQRVTNRSANTRSQGANLLTFQWVTWSVSFSSLSHI